MAVYHQSMEAAERFVRAGWTLDHASYKAVDVKRKGGFGFLSKLTIPGNTSVRELAKLVGFTGVRELE